MTTPPRRCNGRGLGRHLRGGIDMDDATPAIPLEFVERCQAHLERIRAVREQLAPLLAEHAGLVSEYCELTRGVGDEDRQFVAFELVGLGACEAELSRLGRLLASSAS